MAEIEKQVQPLLALKITNPPAEVKVLNLKYADKLGRFPLEERSDAKLRGKRLYHLTSLIH